MNTSNFSQFTFTQWAAHWFEYQQSVVIQGLACVLIYFILKSMFKPLALRKEYDFLLLILFNFSIALPFHIDLTIPSDWIKQPSQLNSVFPSQNMDGNEYDSIQASEIVSSQDHAVSRTEPVSALATFEPKTTSAHTNLHWKAILFLIWGTGCFLYASYIFMQAMRTRHLSQSAVYSSELTILSQELGVGMRMKKTVPVYLTNSHHSPYVYGILNPRIVIPLAIAQQSSTTLRLLITHELLHIKRCDHWMVWLRLAACLLMWWNPLVHWINRRIHLCVEKICDEGVLQHHPRHQSEYSHLLLNTAEWAVDYTPSAASAFSQSKHNLKDRIIHIQNWKGQTMKQFTVSNIAFALLILALLPVWNLTAFTNTNPDWTGRFINLEQHELGKLRWSYGGTMLYDRDRITMFSPDGNYVLAKLDQGPVSLIDIKNNKILQTFGDFQNINNVEGEVYKESFEYHFNSFCWSPDGKTAYVGGVYPGYLWNVETNELINRVVIKDKDPQGVDAYVSIALSAFLPDSKRIALLPSSWGTRENDSITILYEGERQYPIFIYDIEKKQIVHTILMSPYQTNSMVNLCVSPNGDILAEVGDGIVRIYDGTTYQQKADFMQDNLFDIEVSKDSQYIFHANTDMNYQDNAVKVTLAAKPRNGGIPIHIPNARQTQKLFLSHHSNHLLTSSHTEGLILWDISNIRQPQIVTALSDRYFDFSGAYFTPDGKHIYTFSRDGVIAVWNADDGTFQHTIEGDWVSKMPERDYWVGPPHPPEFKYPNPESPAEAPALHVELPDVNLQNKPLSEMFNMLGSQVDIIIREGKWHTEPITYQKKNVKVKQVLEDILPQHGLGYKATGDKGVLITQQSILNHQKPSILLLQKPVDTPLQFINTPLGEFARQLQENTGIPIQIESDPSIPIMATIFRKPPLQNVFDQILPQYGLTYRVQDDTVVIHDLE